MPHDSKNIDGNSYLLLFIHPFKEAFMRRFLFIVSVFSFLLVQSVSANSMVGSNQDLINLFSKSFNMGACAKLNLSDNQKQELMAEFFDFRLKMIGLEADKKMAHLKSMRALLDTSTKKIDMQDSMKSVAKLEMEIAQLKNSLKTNILFDILETDQRMMGMACLKTIQHKKKTMELNKACVLLHHGKAKRNTKEKAKTTTKATKVKVEVKQPKMAGPHHGGGHHSGGNLYKNKRKIEIQLGKNKKILLEREIISKRSRKRHAKKK